LFGYFFCYVHKENIWFYTLRIGYDSRTRNVNPTIFQDLISYKIFIKHDYLITLIDL